MPRPCRRDCLCLLVCFCQPVRGRQRLGLLPQRYMGCTESSVLCSPYLPPVVQTQASFQEAGLYHCRGLQQAAKQCSEWQNCHRRLVALS